MNKPQITVEIAIAKSRFQKQWRNVQWDWEELARKCQEPTVTSETMAQYLKMPKDRQGDIKDVGGFVGGYLAEGKRKSGNVKFRTVVTLDLDRAADSLWDDFTLLFSCAALVYSTHKHTPESPRYRLLIPLGKKVDTTQYTAICRKIAQMLGIAMFDSTTYQVERLMYWPSVPKDGEFYFRRQDGPPLDPGEILGMYTDYSDASEWPIGPDEEEATKQELTRQADPLGKPGLVGAFCRAYTMEEAIEAFLSDVYEPTAHEGRYTYRFGHTAAGLVCMEGKFARSFHETDPAGGKLRNAFDLVRIHKFGTMDEGKNKAEEKLPSFTAMMDFISKDAKTKAEFGRSIQAGANADFDGIEDGGDHDDDWMSELEMNPKKGYYYATSKNFVTILTRDPRLKGKIWLDQFSGQAIICGKLPWKTSGEYWTDRDDANLRAYIETRFGITSPSKIKDAKEVVLAQNMRHPIREYLGSLTWDGTERLDRLVIDYLGAEDSELNRSMTRKHFAAAVNRVFEPGCEYQYCLILMGPEGTGKSSLFSIMGGKWFNDSIVTTDGKEGMETLRKTWLAELAELAGMKKSEVEQVKGWLSKRGDTYRPAYSSCVTEFPRQCVICGTTNEDRFLKGDTGNRRFWVIPVQPELRKKSDWRDALIADRDQLWAEAVYRYREGEPLYLNDELEAQARARQKEYNVNADDALESMLDLYLSIRLPTDWDSYDREARRRYISSPAAERAGYEVNLRERVCAAEFLCEFMNRKESDKDWNAMIRKIGKLLNRRDDFEFMGKSRHSDHVYGICRSYKRIQTPEDNI